MVWFSMINKRHFLRSICLSGVLVAVGVGFVNYHILVSTLPQRYSDIKKVPSAQAALVLGAKVQTNGQLSDILKDRADTALDLYRAKKVRIILASADHGAPEYDEVNALKKYFLDNGVAERDLFLDHAGFDTYDSLYRARDIFKAESLIVVTQDFHLPRAVYIGQALGLRVVGVAADKHVYIGAFRNSLREVVARVKACINITMHAKPRFLGPAIPLSGTSTLSWD